MEQDLDNPLVKVTWWSHAGGGNGANQGGPNAGNGVANAAVAVVVVMRWQHRRKGGSGIVIIRYQN